MTNTGGGGTVCMDCKDLDACELRKPVDGPEVCAKYLARAVAPASLEATLRSLKAAGAIRDFVLEAGVVRLDADLTALELATFPEAAKPQLGDDVERGFTVSSDVGGRRGSGTARAADFEATRSYYAAASSFLMRSKSLKGKARRMWALHVAGLSEREIAGRMGTNRRRVQRQLDAIRLMAGIVTRRK